jgi:hypothetical protein
MSALFETLEHRALLFVTFNDALSNSDNVSQNEKLDIKDVQLNIHGVVQGTIPVYTWGK